MVVVIVGHRQFYRTALVRGQSSHLTESSDQVIPPSLLRSTTVSIQKNYCHVGPYCRLRMTLATSTTTSTSISSISNPACAYTSVCSQNCVYPWEDMGPHLTHSSSSQSEAMLDTSHLNRFSCFCNAHGCDQHTRTRSRTHARTHTHKHTKAMIRL